MKRLALAFALLLPTAASAQSSLMFSDEELRALQAVGAHGGTAGGNAVMVQGNIHLSAILYYGPQQWSIWINGIRVEPGQSLAGASVGVVTERHVDLMVGTEKPQPVRLRPNQTWLAGYGTVVEGAYP